MQKLLQDIDAIVDLSAIETQQLLDAFKQFIDRNFHADPEVLQQVFTIPPHLLLNQQEDEDDVHAHFAASMPFHATHAVA